MRLIYLCFALVALIGCSMEPVHLDPAYRIGKTTASRASEASVGRLAAHEKYLNACVSLRDGRVDEQGILTVISSESVVDWLSQAINEESGGQIQSGPAEHEPKFPLITVEKSYVSYKSLVLSGIVVLSFEYEGDKQFFRGQYSKTNWNGSPAEHTQVLNYALRDAIMELLDEHFVRSGTRRYLSCQGELSG